jgi:hypothetical protein
MPWWSQKARERAADSAPYPLPEPLAVDELSKHLAGERL